MPRYYCDYCDTYLTHDSPSVRKQHNAGYKHKANVRSYYQQYEAQLNQTLIDQKVKEHLGQAAAYQLRPRPPVLQTPVMPIPGSSPLVPGLRPPVLLRPVPGVPGYVSASVMPTMVAPPGAPNFPGQINSVPRPVTVSAPTMVPGSAGTPTSSGPPPMFGATMYQPSTAARTTGGFNNTFSSALSSDANH